jgi:hypothetical protein
MQLQSGIYSTYSDRLEDEVLRTVRNDGFDGSFWWKKMSFSSLVFYKNVNTYKCMITYLYKYMYVHSIPINIFERLFDPKIHKVGHQERLTIDRNVVCY